MLTVYHNNRCSKSRECVAFLDDSNQQYEIVEYLKTPLKFREINALLKKLGLRAIDIVRTKEPQWNPYKNLVLTNDEIVRLLAKHPILIERPIIVKGNKAVIGRPIERIAELF